MVLLLADEDFNGAITGGILRRQLEADMVRVQDVGLAGAADATILDWAADKDREVGQSLPIGQAIEELLIVTARSLDGEWENRMQHLPLR